MSKGEIEEKVRGIFLDLFHKDIRGDIAATQFPAWDSLTHIKLIMTLERVFGVKIPISDVTVLYSSFDRIVGYLSSKLGNEQ